MILMETHKIEVPPDAVITGIMLATVGSVVYEENGKYFSFEMTDKDPQLTEPKKLFFPDDWVGRELMSALKVIRKFYKAAELASADHKEPEEPEHKPLPPGVESRVIAFPGKQFEAME